MSQKQTFNREQIQKYQFFYDKLNDDLYKAEQKAEDLTERRNAYDEIDDWMWINQNSKEKKFQKLTEIGDDVFVKVETERTPVLNLDIGLGVYLECNFEEARKIIPKAKSLMETKIKNCSWDIDRIKSIQNQWQSNIKAINSLM